MAEGLEKRTSDDARVIDYNRRKKRVVVTMEGLGKIDSASSLIVHVPTASCVRENGKREKGTNINEAKNTRDKDGVISTSAVPAGMNDRGVN